MFPVKRRQYYVDERVQGALMGRTVFYWFMSALTTALLVLCWRILFSPGRPFEAYVNYMRIHYGPALVASLIVVPLLVIDVLKLSNRFAGPLFRLHRAIRQLADGQEVRPIKFRENDFWQSFADDFNVVAAQLTTERAERRRLEAELVALRGSTPRDEADFQPDIDHADTDGGRELELVEWN